jgi:hypothetical protein
VREPAHDLTAARAAAATKIERLLEVIEHFIES